MRWPTRHMSHGGRSSRAPEVPRPVAHAMAGVGLHREDARSAVKYGALLLVISKETHIFQIRPDVINFKSYLNSLISIDFLSHGGECDGRMENTQLLTCMYGNNILSQFTDILVLVYRLRLRGSVYYGEGRGARGEWAKYEFDFSGLL